MATMLKSTKTAKKRSLPSVPEYLEDAVPWVPELHHKLGLKFLLEHPAALILMDPGLGKTSITYAASKILKSKNMMNGVLVVSTVSVISGPWLEEREVWQDFNHFKVVTLHGNKKDDAVYEDNVDFYLINFEGLKWFIESGHLLRLMRAGKINTLVIDEISKLKKSSTNRFHLLEPYLKMFDRRWGLTGSPASNSLIDLFGQCYVLDLGAALGPFITHYKSIYFTPVDDAKFVWVPKEGCEELIYKKVKPLALRMKAEDYIKMPKLRVVPKQFVLPKPARDLYDEMESQLLAVIDDKSVLAVNKAVLSNKLRQLCSGAVYFSDIDPETGEVVRGDKKTWAIVHDAKLDLLEDLVDELQGQPLFVAYEWGHDLIRLRERFPDAPYIGSGVSLARRRQLVKEWNAGMHPVFFGHPQSVGHGLNMQKGNAHHIAWFTLTWDYELWNQFCRRLMRSGNNSAVVFSYHFRAKDSIEDMVQYSLNRKQSTENAFLDAMGKVRLPKRRDYLGDRARKTKAMDKESIAKALSKFGSRT